MDVQLKEDIKKFIWPMIQIVIIGLIILFIIFTRSYNATALEKVDELEKRVENQEKMINLLIITNQNNCKADTIIINVNTTKK